MVQTVMMQLRFVLTNESHTVAIDDSGFVATTEIENARTNVLAYKGANSVTPKITRVIV